MSSYPYRIQQYLLVYFTHRKYQYPYSRIQAANFLEKNIYIKFPALPKIISVDRQISNRKQFHSIFPHIQSRFIEKVFHTIKKNENFPALAKIVSMVCQVYDRKEFQSIFQQTGGKYIDEVYHKFPHCRVLHPQSKNFRSVNSFNITRIHRFLPLPYSLSKVLHSISEQQMRYRCFAEQFCRLTLHQWN